MADPLSVNPVFKTSPTTQAALSSLQDVLDSRPPPQAPTQPSAPPVQAPGEPAVAEGASEPLKSFRNTRPDLVRHRKLVEERSPPIEISAALRGRLAQDVVIHAEHMRIRFQDLTYTDRRLQSKVVDEQRTKGELGPLEANMVAMLYPLSFGIVSINGIPLPEMTPNSKEHFMARVAFVSDRLSGTWLELAWANFNWFLERCAEITTEELGNG